ncbi:tyrosine-type recombinase/integrase [Ruminococcus sp. 5_1_39BFAA]|uniref:tyrosine-type recombinase/integrase n=1 Tax=Ruminococcus sp. 5_1_39BFAA TaxID=457412 RepID=UPI00356A8FCA
MAEKSKKYPHAFFERNSWYHRTKVLQEDYSVKYGKIGGFKTDKEAEDAYNKHMEEFDRTMKVKLLPQGKDITVKEYLVYWYESIFSERIESTTGYVSAYVLYSFLLPSIDDDMKLRLINVEYINAVLKAAAKYCESAGNKSRELLFIAFKDAVVERMIPNNPVIGTKKYPRKKANVMILNKEQTKRFLLAAKARNWFLEIILALYLGLRKGEILGLKFSDFDMEKKIVHIQRQLVSDVKVEKGGYRIEEYNIVERDPKTEKSNRILRVPNIVLVELEKRRQMVQLDKSMLGEQYCDSDYVSCQKNGLRRGLSSLNSEINRICEANLLPHITVHGLRHMFATILLERGVSIAKISGMLGHSSVHTTFEFYLEIMDEDTKMMEFMNKEFVPEVV